MTDADTLEISVSDTGLGMTRAQMDGLFQPYNRLGRERGAVEGTGIGLVISRRLAELMGGSLRAHSVSGEGSTFVLDLPRANLAESGLATDDDVPAHLSADYHRRLVHYIEDNETNVEVMRGMLQRRPQVLLAVSMNGLDGLAAIRQRRPSLILLDMHLPDIDGLELLRHLQGRRRPVQHPGGGGVGRCHGRAYRGRADGRCDALRHQAREPGGIPGASG